MDHSPALFYDGKQIHDYYFYSVSRVIMKDWFFIFIILDYIYNHIEGEGGGQREKETEREDQKVHHHEAHHNSPEMEQYTPCRK